MTKSTRPTMYRDSCRERHDLLLQVLIDIEMNELALSQATRLGRTPEANTS